MLRHEIYAVLLKLPGEMKYFDILFIIYRHLLEEKVQEFIHAEKEKQDIKKTIVVLLFTIFALTLFGGIFQTNMLYITSQSAYNNGENVHHRFSEIIKLKELLVKGSVNFWSSGNSLGYPLLMTTQLFPTFSAAVFVFIGERFAFLDTNNYNYSSII